MTAEEFAAELRLAGAVKLYEIGRLSSGAAAHVAGIPENTSFLTRLADFDVDTFRMTEEDFSPGDAVWLRFSPIRLLCSTFIKWGY